MEKAIKITIVSFLITLLTSCSICGVGSPSIDIQRISVDGHYYIIETNTSTGTTTMTTVR